MKLTHFSPHKNLKEIDPAKMGSGVDARARRDTWHPHTFFYDLSAGAPEDMVTQGAQSKYSIELQPHQKIYDLASDPEKIIANSVAQNNGALNMDKIHEGIKAAGYHGFQNKAHPTLPHVVAMYDKQPVSSEETLKSEPMAKGSRQRKMPFNPAQVPDQQKQTLASWQTYGNSGLSQYSLDPRKAREKLKPIDSNAKQRALNRLSAKTKSRTSSKGGREFLLHRGMSAEEGQNSSKVLGKISHAQNSSWTPNFDLAQSFQDPAYAVESNEMMGEKLDSFNPGHTASAWIHENDIHHIPTQYGSYGEKQGENQYRGEHEIIVKPHSSPLATQEDTAHLRGLSVHDRINENAESHRLPASTPDIDQNQRATSIRSLKGRIKSGRELGRPAKPLAASEMAKANPMKTLGTAAMMGVAAMSPVNGHSSSEMSPQQASSIGLDQRAQAKKDTLKAIARVETTNGLHTKHKVMTTGENAGDAAYGTFGLMPKTIKDVVHSNPSLKHKYGQVLSLNGEQIHSFAKEHPELEYKVAGAYYDRLYRAFGGSLPHILYGWLNGEGGTKKYVSKGKDPKNHWYVKRVMQGMGQK